MNIFDKVKRFFRIKSEESFDINDPRLWGKAYEGGNLSEATYFICLKSLSESVAKLPLKLYRNKDGGAVPASNDALYNILKLRPNPHMTSSHFWAAVVNLMYHYGNSFAYIKRNKNMLPEALYILDNLHIHIYDDNARILSSDGGIWYVYTEPLTGRVFKFHEDDILHFKTLQSLDGITGMSVAEILARNLDGLKEGQEFLNNMYKSGFTGKVAVEYTQELSDKLRDRLISTIESAAQANSGLNFIPVAPGVRLSPLNIKLTDAQYLELRKFSSLQIAAAFGVKPNQLNDYEKSSYANSENQYQTFYKDTLLALLKHIEEELTYKLLSDRQIRDGYFFKFNVDVILRADFATRMEGYAKGRQNGWLSADDIRSKEDMPPIGADKGGDKYLINGNMVPLEENKTD